MALSLLMSCGGGSGSDTNAPDKTASTVTLTQVVSGLSAPLDLEQPADGSGRTFVVQQGGKILILQNGTIILTPFLDITSRVTSGGETGLLGLAFHPNYAQNGLFYVNYTRTNTSGQLQTVIAEYKVTTGNPNLADISSERILITQDQPFTNHNGGQLAFGPDGFLYIGLGDGGSGGDPNGNGQNTNVLLGKILRIDVDHTTTNKPYAIPSDNPFVNSGGLPEIYAYGFRNPWRFSFDTTSKRLFVGDVGENSFEEIDIVNNGKNYGWNIMEGSHCFNPSTNCNMTGLTLPIFDYSHSDGTTVIGGFVYHGSAISTLQGKYVFGDFGNGKIWSLTEGSNGSWTRADLIGSSRQISAFGVDSSTGEIYVVDYSGSILKLTPSGS